MAQPLVFSYTRWSSPRQSLGHSNQRQREMADEYLARRGLVVQDANRLGDIGSAWTGYNKEKGALAGFLAAVKAGDVPWGSILLIEAMDRLTRQNVLDALPLVSDLLNRGVEIVTTEDSQSYTREAVHENEGLIWLLVGKIREANRRSERSSGQLKKMWGGKRTAAAERKAPVSKWCPAWLELSADRASYVDIPDRVKVVERIFALAAEGHGKDTIARLLNTEGVPPFDLTRRNIGGDKRRVNGWHRAFVAQILRNRAVLGEWTPHHKAHSTAGKRVPVPQADPVDLYPQIIKHDLFRRAQATREKWSGKGGGRRGSIYRNILSGLGRCGACSGRVIFRNKGVRRPGSPQQGYLVCDGGGRAYKCAATTHHSYAPLEEAAIFLSSLVIERNMLPERGGAATALQGAEADALARIERLEGKAGRLHALAAEGSTTVWAALKPLEAELQAERDKLEAVRRELAVARDPAPSAEWRIILKTMQEEDARATEDADRFRIRSRMAALIKQVVDVIWFFEDRTAVFYLGKDWVRGVAIDGVLDHALVVKHAEGEGVLIYPPALANKVITLEDTVRDAPPYRPAA